MRLSLLPLGGLLASLPTLSLAQATAAAPVPRYYVGLAAYSSAYQPLGGGGYRGTTVPVQATVGYQLRPRLAVQVGVVYTSRTGTFTYDGVSFSSPVYYNYYSRTTNKQTSVALLARYTLTRQPAHRFQVDLLGGTTLQTAHYTSTSVETDSSRSPVTQYYARSDTRTSVLLTAGSGVRYHFGQHLEALFDFTLSYDLRRYQFGTSVLTGATALGLRYRFGGLH